MSKQVRFDFHIFTPGMYHIPSEDCWCEPVRSYWVTDKTGKQLHVLEHNDDHFEDNWVQHVLDDLR